MRAERAHHTTCQAADLEGKPHKEEETCAPDGMRIAKSFLSADAILVDQNYGENTEERAEPGNKIYEGGVHGKFVSLYGGCACAKRMTASKNVQILK